MEHIIGTIISWWFGIVVAASLTKWLIKGFPPIYLWDGVKRKPEDPNWAVVDPTHNDTGSRHI